ncbi:MAG: amino acid ABC transporter substrate-binding protein [Treponema sp. CETP13]|nr:MAG: amino acid ABC transporter substrate-binding protein [Treponema sp. CETP13]
MKKIIKTALILVVLVSLIGCKKEKSSSITRSNNDSTNITQSKKIRVAHSQTYIPYAFVDENGNSDGYEVKVFMAIDEYLDDYEFEYIPTSSEDLLIGLDSGKYDVGVKGAWYTEERAKKFLFPEHYIGASSLGLVIRTENADEITDMDSFAKYSGKLVPISPQSAQYSVITDYNNTHEDKIILQASDTFDVAGAYQWVLEGRYDGYMDLKTLFEENVLKEDAVYNDLSKKLTYITYQAIPTYPLFNNKQSEFIADYNKAFAALMENGTIKNLEMEYFGEDLFQYVAK